MKGKPKKSRGWLIFDRVDSHIPWAGGRKGRFDWMEDPAFLLPYSTKKEAQAVIDRYFDEALARDCMLVRVKDVENVKIAHAMGARF